MPAFQHPLAATLQSMPSTFQLPLLLVGLATRDFRLLWLPLGQILAGGFNATIKKGAVLCFGKDLMARPRGAINCSSFYSPQSTASSGMPSGHSQFIGFTVGYLLVLALERHADDMGWGERALVFSVLAGIAGAVATSRLRGPAWLSACGAGCYHAGNP